MPAAKKEIVLVDDHLVIRTALKELIEKLGNYSVVLEFDHGKALLENLSRLKTTSLIILDISMPVMNGMDTLLKLKAQENQIPVLILTDLDDDRQAVRVFRLGARGYLRKNCSSKELNEALKEIFSSGYYHNKYFVQSIHQDVPATQDKKTEKEKILEQLTSRERLFLKLVSHPDEYTYTEFADKMQIPPRAVEKCREDLFTKLRIKSKVGLAIFVYRNDLYADL